MRTNRCINCDVNWPTDAFGRYYNCPACGQRTDQNKDLDPITEAQAKALILTAKESKRKHDEFEAFYAEREAVRLAAEVDEWGVAEVPKPPKRKRASS